MLAAGTTSRTTSAAAKASGQASKQPQEAAQAVELDADELHTYKRRLVDLLQPHETVLAALRRLGGLHGTTHAGSDALPWKRARKAAGVQSCLAQPLFSDAYSCCEHEYMLSESLCQAPAFVVYVLEILG